MFDVWRRRKGADVVCGTLEEALGERDGVDGSGPEAFCNIFRKLLTSAWSHMDARASAITLERDLK